MGIFAWSSRTNVSYDLGNVRKGHGKNCLINKIEGIIICYG